ncbi:helix-turn-helix domain-containing protein [Ornithobacterium rhinotracheale]|uniref:helix-turn-helix domain-containing protein n=1 Tax=Ornithobacterium rhinotracheale TaxID=28251 RepID=UPI001FF2E90D|nr:helix-turn-helix transcriptional regulator [Ornithobacterium rhinotracheale]MCK0199128.1 helix-turn-helix domain-containing protein [Ornithobacterium rhinotracheale]
MLSERIKQIIKQKGLTSIEVAKQLNVTRESFSKTINGNPTISSLQSIANVLGCEVGDFFTTSEPIILKFKDDLHTFYSLEELKSFIAEQS